MSKTSVKNNSRFGTSILAEDLVVSNDSLVTGRNANHLVIGCSGSGKSLSYTLANILSSQESFIVSDCKGSLYHRAKKTLEQHGYKVYNIDFKNFKNSTVGYNPLRFIGKDEDGCPLETDIKQIAGIICPEDNQKDDKFWGQAAAHYLSAAIDYALYLPENEQNLSCVQELCHRINTDEWRTLIEQHATEYPDSLCVKVQESIEQSASADRMQASILGILDSNLSRIVTKQYNHIYTMDQQIDFKKLGSEKSALFLNVSDTDRSNDSILELFFSQAFHELVEFADQQPDYRLPIPCRVYLDDFASTYKIKDFDQLSSNIRSRDISCSVMIQSMSQLEAMYDLPTSLTISENMDVWIYLGGQSMNTIRMIADKVDKTTSSILNMRVGDSIVMQRGEKPFFGKRYQFQEHIDFENL